LQQTIVRRVGRKPATGSRKMAKSGTLGTCDFGNPYCPAMRRCYSLLTMAPRAESRAPGVSGVDSRRRHQAEVAGVWIHRLFSSILL
jgi:hypothetical protein